MTTTTPGHGVVGIPVSVEELELAWRAVRGGQFRRRRRRSAGGGVDGSGGSGAPDLVVAPVVLVAGAHGWSGTSTTALLIADAAARQGLRVRLVDAAAPTRSGFAAAATTEHGADATGWWRVGSRDGVAVQRLAHAARRVDAVPVPPAGEEGILTVVDVGWPLPDLLGDLEDLDDLGGLKGLGAGPAVWHWLGALLPSAPLVLTARATVPGLRHIEATAEALSDVRGPGNRIVLALLGPRTLPRVLTAAAGAAVLAARQDRLLVMVPDRPGLTQAGLTPAPLPRQLRPAGDQLLMLTGPADPVESQRARHEERTRTRPAWHLPTRVTTPNKDER